MLNNIKNKVGSYASVEINDKWYIVNDLDKKLKCIQIIQEAIMRQKKCNQKEASAMIHLELNTKNLSEYELRIYLENLSPSDFSLILEGINFHYSVGITNDTDDDPKTIGFEIQKVL